MWKQILFSIICSVTFLSCDNELHMLFPEGPAGMSAYEVWVKEVLAGNIDWPEDRTDVNNFFLYLKGEDGKDGNDGKSAYELWKEEVARGLDNPHNPGHEWPKDQTDMNDFWYYLSGADGENGVTPNIGENGNWWINGEDTGIPAQGKDGQDGQDGATPVIGENGNWWIGGVDTGVPAYGKDGEDGATPEIGQNGNWWINGVDTGVPAKGQDGEDGTTPHIGENGNWWIGNVDTGVPAKGQDGEDGEDGVTPHIGDNGNWWIGNVDTGIPAQGKDGQDGQDGEMPDITIGLNGNWWINGEDTGVPAQGKDGQDGNDGNDGQPGANGQSAYELWVEEVEAGRVYKNGELWPTNMTSVADFWEFLRGEDGKDGQDGQDGQDGATIMLGSPNVIIQYYGDPELKEYVDWADGSVTYKVYDKTGKVVSGGTKVKGIPESDREYTTDADGFITVPAKDLPADKAYMNIQVEVKTNGASDFEQSANNTIVPARMQVRLVINDAKIPTVGLFGTGEDQAKPCVNVWFKVQRKKLDTTGKGEWEGIPAELGNTQKTVDIYEYRNGIDKAPESVATRTQIEVADDETGHNYNNCRVQIKRKFIYTDLKYLDKAKVAESDDYWGPYSTGNFRYARIGIEGCYGENIMLQSYIKLLPAQFTPTISEITRGELYGDGSTGGTDDLVNLTGNLDVSKVKKELFLADAYKKASQGVGGLDVYEPVVGEIDKVGEIFKINFSSSTTSTNIIQSKVKIDGAFTARAVNYQSTVDLTNNQMANFYNLSLGNINGASGTLYLRVNGNYVSAPEGVGDNGIEIQVK